MYVHIKCIEILQTSKFFLEMPLKMGAAGDDRGRSGTQFDGFMSHPLEKHCQKIRSRNALPGLHTKASEGVYQGNGIGHVSITLIPGTYLIDVCTNQVEISSILVY
jgi:hypothetical protein